MEREIKFRAKALAGGWVYGNFIHSERFKGCSNEYRIHEPKIGLEHDIDIDTLGQFTGLKDKNGKEAYNKDICKGTIYGYDYDILIVEKRNGCFGVYEPETKIFLNFYTFIDNDYSFEIIGNTTDNPELLKDA